MLMKLDLLELSSTLEFIAVWLFTFDKKMNFTGTERIASHKILSWWEATQLLEGRGEAGLKSCLSVLCYQQKESKKHIWKGEIELVGSSELKTW